MRKYYATKKIKYNNLIFDSGLELYFYKLLESNNLLIRFGGNFNVSAPIQVDDEYLRDFCKQLIHFKTALIVFNKSEFENL